MSEASGVATVETSPLDQVVRRIEDISTLPQIALEVTRVVSDPDAGAADLKRVVENDPSLSARILRVVNSAAYGLSSPVTNLHQAISYLGFSQVRNLAVTACVSHLFRDDAKFGGYTRSGLWRHLVTVAIAARLIACRVRLPNFEDAFLAGLLHDIGVILEDQHDHENFRQAMQADPATSLIDAENAVMGYNHTMLGERIAEHWRFPPLVRNAIRHHHNSHLYRGAGADVVRCVEIANVICTAKGVTAVGRKNLRSPAETFRAMSITREDVLVLAGDIDRAVRQSERLFDL